MSPEAYRRQLLATLVPVTAPAGPIPWLPADIWFAPSVAEKPVSLTDLYNTGIECGHGETREYLRQRIACADVELDGGRARLQEAHAELARVSAEGARQLDEARRAHEQRVRDLEQEVGRARDRIDELERSTFWRLTLPLRWISHRGKLAVRSTRRLAHRTRLLRTRFGTARQIAKDQGLAELLRRVGEKAAGRAHKPAGLRERPGLEPAIVPLHIASSESPRVSVIVPTYGQDLHTFTCLKALAAEASAVPLEVIVMDDCAPTPAAEALRDVHGVRFERNARNLGFLLNCNRGAGLARGEYLLFLNNDAVLVPGALAAMLGVFDSVAAAGAVGAKLVYPDGRLQEAGAIVWRDASAWNVGRGEDPDRPEYNYVREVDYCSAACLLVPRALFAQLGGFDERYVPAYCEDADFCLKVREAGRRVLYQPAAEVVHFEGVSHGTDTASGLKSYQVDNQRKLRERWESRLAGHRVNGRLPRLERDRGARYRVLLIEACMLTPDQDSGSLRTWRLIEVLQGLGCKVTFAADNLEKREPYVGRLQQAGVEVLYAPHLGSVDGLLEERGTDFDVVILARYYVASRHIAAVRRHAPRAVLVFDTLDLHYLRHRRLAALEGSLTVAQAAQSIHHEEIDCIKRCDLTWVVSEVERQVLATEVPRARVQVLSNIHEVKRGGRPFAEREGLLFVGGFRHPPNVDGIFWYAREIAPLLRELLPGVTTYVIGSSAPRAVLDLQAEGLEVLGYVVDLEPWLERCRLSVSPLRYGAGVKGKVNQAMSHGLPVVATAPSVEGMHLVPGEEVLVADEPRPFAEAAARLYRDEALWNRLSRAGMDNIDAHFSRRVAARALEELFHLVERRRKA